MPAQFDARLKSGGGGVEVVDLTGEVKAQTGGGGLSFARLNGALNGETGGGGVKAGACEGTLALRTGGGGMEVIGGSGSLDGKLRGWLGDREEVSGTGARQYRRRRTYDRESSGAVEASTGGGSISAVLPSELSDTVKLSTGGGGINVSVPATAAFSLDAKTARRKRQHRAACGREGQDGGWPPARPGQRRRQSRAVTQRRGKHPPEEALTSLQLSCTLKAGWRRSKAMAG